MRNVSVSFTYSHDLALLFRIPHSEFRIGVIPHFEFHIPHSRHSPRP